MSTPRARVCVVGAGGRMGQRVCRLLQEHAHLSLSVALTRPEKSVAGVPCVASPHEALERADVVIDFAAPAVCSHLAPLCAATQVPYLVASTGLQAADEAALEKACAQVAVLHAANLSVGINVMAEALELVAARLPGWDTEIAEIHHRHKRDAPSGTALVLGEAVQAGAGAKQAVIGRHGQTPVRDDGELGYASMRGGDVAGEHTVFFFGPAERLEFTHRAANGDIFAAGALHAAHWLLRRPPGRYSMRDVLQPHQEPRF